MSLLRANLFIITSVGLNQLRSGRFHCQPKRACHDPTTHQPEYNLYLMRV
jgi:hypothetical protein